MLLAVTALGGTLCWAAEPQKDKEPKALMLGGEWTPEGAETRPEAFRGCLVNRTYSTVVLTIARPSFATTYALPPGGHYRLWLYKGEAVFVAGDPAVNKITAFAKHNVAGETTVSISPTTVTFQRGVEECLKHVEKESKQK